MAEINTLEGLKRRVSDIEECISDLEDRIMEINQRETSFQRLDTGSRETRQRTKRELSYGETSL